MKTHIKLAIGCIVASLATSASAQITYVDANTGNTVVAPSYGGGAFVPFIGQSGVANDGVWDERAFGNSLTIYQNAQSGQVDINAVRLVTSVTGLPLGTYDVFAYFWSDTSSWRMGASLTDGTLGSQLSLYQFNPNSPGTTQWYTGADGAILSSNPLVNGGVNPFTTDVMVGDGNRRLIQINLGSITGTGFDVFIDPDRAQPGQDARTWYDGIGYSVVPEPSTFALAGLGIAALAAFRRRKA